MCGPHRDSIQGPSYLKSDTLPLSYRATFVFAKKITKDIRKTYNCEYRKKSTPLQIVLQGKWDIAWQSPQTGFLIII